MLSSSPVLSVPGLPGGSVATGNGSGSILLTFDNEEPTRSISAGQQPQRQPPAPSPLPPPPPSPQQQQQPGGSHGRRLNTVNCPWQQLCVDACVTGYQAGPEPGQTTTGSLLYHQFAVPQHPGSATVVGVGHGAVRFSDPLVSCPSNTQDSCCTPEESQERGSENRNGTAAGRKMAWRVPSTRCRGRAQRSASSSSLSRRCRSHPSSGPYLG